MLELLPRLSARLHAMHSCRVDCVRINPHIILIAVQSIQQAAAELAPFCEGSNAEEVAAFLSNLGGIGAGLHELMRADQNIGGIFRE